MKSIKALFFHPAIAALVFASAIYAFKGAALARREVVYLNPPPEYIEYFTFGFRESAADSFWLRWIQDNDTCQTYDSKILYNLEKLPDKTPDESLFWVPRHKVCENSWSFKMLDAVTKLAPKFEMPYLAGGSTLAILVEDFVGASEIYRRGIEQFPNNWQLLYRASFHYQFNLKDIPRAADLLIQVADKGGPIWARALASRLYTAGGQLEQAIHVLEAFRKSLNPETEKNYVEASRRLDKRIVELRQKLKELPAKSN